MLGSSSDSDSLGGGYFARRACHSATAAAVAPQAGVQTGCARAPHEGALSALPAALLPGPGRRALPPPTRRPSKT